MDSHLTYILCQFFSISSQDTFVDIVRKATNMNLINIVTSCILPTPPQITFCQWHFKWNHTAKVWRIFFQFLILIQMYLCFVFICLVKKNKWWPEFSNISGWPLFLFLFVSAYYLRLRRESCWVVSGPIFQTPSGHKIPLTWCVDSLAGAWIPLWQWISSQLSCVCIPWCVVLRWLTQD